MTRTGLTAARRLVGDARFQPAARWSCGSPSLAMRLRTAVVDWGRSGVAVVLTAAMHAFRHDGYAGISVARLEEATGLRASSLYNAFGNKAGLFRCALGHYVSTFIGARLAEHAGPEATLEDLEGLFLSLLEPPLDDGFGCLVINSATELGRDPLATPGVAAGIAAVTRHLDEVLARELGDTRDAAGLLLLYLGLLVLSPPGLTTDRHRAAVLQEFARLRAQRKEAR